MMFILMNITGNNQSSSTTI